MKRTLFFALFLGMIPYHSANALTASSETKPFLAANYGERVLNTILTKWKKPQIEVTGVTAITIRMAQDGRPYSCEIRHNSSSPDTDNSICRTVAEIGQFPPLEANDTGEIYLSFVHDDKPFLPAAAKQDIKQTVNATEQTISGKEQVDKIKNPIENPIHEIQKNAQVNIDESAITDENALPRQSKINQTVQKQNPETGTAANTASSLPLATKPQPQTMVISREEALQPPSKDLADPAQFIQTYSQDILRQASPKIRIPSNVQGKHQVIARIDVSAEGKLKNAAITKSSANTILDGEILRVLTKEVVYAPLPDKTEQSLWITFNITK